MVLLCVPLQRFGHSSCHKNTPQIVDLKVLEHYYLWQCSLFLSIRKGMPIANISTVSHVVAISQYDMGTTEVIIINLIIQIALYYAYILLTIKNVIFRGTVFRPAYKSINEIRSTFEYCPILLATATCSEALKSNMLQIMKIPASDIKTVAVIADR